MQQRRRPRCVPDRLLRFVFEGVGAEHITPSDTTLHAKAVGGGRSGISRSGRGRDDFNFPVSPQYSAANAQRSTLLHRLQPTRTKICTAAMALKDNAKGCEGRAGMIPSTCSSVLHLPSFSAPSSLLPLLSPSVCACVCVYSLQAAAMAVRASLTAHQPLAKRHKSPFGREELDEVSVLAGFFVRRCE